MAIASFVKPQYIHKNLEYHTSLGYVHVQQGRDFFNPVKNRQKIWTRTPKEEIQTGNKHMKKASGLISNQEKWY